MPLSSPSLRIVNRDALTPIVLTCEHASPRLPPGMRASSDAERRVLASHWGWDIGAWALTHQVARRLQASAVGGRWSRLVVDLNRTVSDPTLIRREAEGIRLGWNAGLTPRLVERRMLRYHVPYHAAIDALAIRRLARGVKPLLLAMHSFTGLYDGHTRNFQAGVLFDRSPRQARALAQGLKTGGLSVRYNEPYSGRAGMMYAIHRHGSHHGLPCLELEINQDCLTNPAAVRSLGAVVAQALRPLLG